MASSLNRSHLVLAALAAAVLGLLAGIYTRSPPVGTGQAPLPVVSENAVARLLGSRFDDIDGQARQLSEWRGKTLVVNFWATWCPPCRDEMPGFSRVQERHAARGVQFVGIALDAVDDVRAFSRQFPVSYPLLIAGTQGGVLVRDLGNPQLALPHTIVLSPSGELRLLHLGLLPEDELERVLQGMASR